MHYGRVSTLIYFKLLPHLSHGTTKEGLEKHVFRYPTTWPRFVRYGSVEGSILHKTRSCQLAVATPDMTMICSILSNFYIKRNYTSDIFDQPSYCVASDYFSCNVLTFSNVMAFVVNSRNIRVVFFANYLFNFGLLYDAATSSDHTSSNGTIIGE